MAVTTGIVLIVLLESVLLHGRVSFVDACTSVAGILYLGLPFAHMVMLRGLYLRRRLRPRSVPLRSAVR